MIIQDYIDRMLAMGLIDNTVSWNRVSPGGWYKWFTLPGLYNNVVGIKYATSKKAVLYDTFRVIHDGKLDAESPGKNLSFEEIIERIPNVICHFNMVKKQQRLNKIEDI